MSDVHSADEDKNKTRKKDKQRHRQRSASSSSSADRVPRTNTESSLESRAKKMNKDLAAAVEVLTATVLEQRRKAPPPTRVPSNSEKATKPPTPPKAHQYQSASPHGRTSWSWPTSKSWGWTPHEYGQTHMDHPPARRSTNGPDTGVNFQQENPEQPAWQGHQGYYNYWNQ